MSSQPLEQALLRAQYLALDVGDRRAALALIDSALATHPIDSDSLLDRPYSALASALAYAGRPDRVAALLPLIARQNSRRPRS